MDRFHTMAGSFEKALSEAAVELVESGMPGVKELKERVLACSGYARL